MSVLSKPSAAARRCASSRGTARNACGVCTPARWSADRAQVAAEQPRQLHDGQRPAVLAGGRDRGLEQRRAGQRPGTVVHRDHVDAPASMSSASACERRPLRGVPGGPAGDQPDLAVPQQRRDGLADGVLVARADAEHQPHHVRDRRARRAPTGRARWCRRGGAAPCWSPRRPGCRSRRRGSRRRRARTNCYMPVARVPSGETRRP